MIFDLDIWHAGQWYMHTVHTRLGRACYLSGHWCVCMEQRYKIVSAEVEPEDEDCDWPSDPEDSLPVSRPPG